MKKRFNAVTLVLVCFAGFLLASLCFAAFVVFEFGSADSIPFAAKFAEIYSAIDKDYVGQPDMEKVSDAAYSAMIAAIDDRWSYYMTDEQYEQYQQYQSNSYTGIGVTIEKDENSGLYKVTVVLEDSPASQAGINIGDLMVAIDGQALSGKTSDEVKQLIEEKQGADFELTLRSQDGTERSIEVAAKTVFSKPVKYEMLDGNIGYIKIKNFEGDSGDEIISAVDGLVADGAKGIVFDVRNNPGGLLSELLKALDHLLPEGDMFVSVNEQGEETVKRSDADCVEIPMTVLVNENSYSAAEFFAAALSEYDLSSLVGTHTTGKARSQVNIVLRDGSAVHISTNSYLTPKRVDLSEKGGLAPDISVSISKEDEAKLVSGLLEHDKDPQLIAALDEIKALIDK
ncbi:MAG: PDZ domain-containing protein [Clostridia bacterium]|nr:PDZ domain-containing protein [Clostridia bacterium]